MTSRALSAAAAPAQPVAPAVRGFWTYPFAIYHSASHSADSLVLVLATALGASVAMAALIDAVGSLATALGLLVAGRLADRLRSPRALVAGAFALAALIALGLAGAPTPVALLAVSALWGLVYMAGAPAASVFITRSFGPAAWASQIVRYQTVITVGAAVGVVVSIAWLGATRWAWGETAAVRSYYILGAGTMALAALAAWGSLRAKTGPGAPKHAVPHRGPSPYNDRLKSIFVVAAVLFLGLGMASTAVPLYLIRGLGAESYKVMAASLGFMVAGSLALPLAERAMARLLPLRLFSVAILGRCLCLVLMGCAGLLLSPGIAQGAVILLMATAGFCSSFAVVSSSTRLVGLAPLGHKGAASGQYSALTFVALAAGGALSGVVAQNLGFLAAFLMASLLLLVAAVLALRL